MCFIVIVKTLGFVVNLLRAVFIGCGKLGENAGYLAINRHARTGNQQKCDYVQGPYHVLIHACALSMYIVVYSSMLVRPYINTMVLYLFPSKPN